MQKTTDTDLLLAGRKYDITPARLGDSSFQRRIERKSLMFPSTFPQAANSASYYYQDKLSLTEPLPDAMAMILFAEGYIKYWPSNIATCKSFMGTWKGSPFYIPLDLAKGAMQEYAITSMTLDKLLGNKRNDDYKLYRYWFGLREIKEGKVSYYPTIAEISSNNIKGFEKVMLEDGSKNGTINLLLDFEGNEADNTKSAVFSVSVNWDDGTSSIEPYCGLRHLTPQGEASCRLQDILGAYKSGLNNIEEKNYTDILEKMAAMMVYVAFGFRFGQGANDLDIVNAICLESSKTQQAANMTNAYKNFTEVDTATGAITAYGWGADSGMAIVRKMYEYVKGKGMRKVADWGAFPEKFLDKVQEYGLGETVDTGLVVCPDCKLCERVENADFIDFGVYFGKDSNPLTSVEYSVDEKDGNRYFQAIGRIKCSGCSSDYYRKFKPIMRREVEQMPIGEGELSQKKPYTTQWIIRSTGYGAKVGQVMGYSFIEHLRGRLPMIRFYLSYAGRTMAVDYPLEVGALSRSGRKDTLCTGASLVPNTITKSHTYYDNNFAPPLNDPSSPVPIPQLGKGTFKGPNYNDFSRTDPTTNLKLCDWCEKTGASTTLSEGKTFMRGARDVLNIDRGDGSAIFDRQDKDYFERNGKIYYKLRVTSPDGSTIIRYLDVWADNVGGVIGSAPPPIETQIKGNVCNNDLWVSKYSELIGEYAESLKTEKGIVSKFVVCEGLAWSARYDTKTRSWIPSEPADMSIWMNDVSITYPDGLTYVIDEDTWNDGVNRKNTFGDGTQEDRFPAPQCGGQVSFKSPFGTCMNSQTIPTSHEIEVVNVEDEEVTTPAGVVIKRITHLWCRTCEESFIGSPDDISGNAFIIPFSTDPSNVPVKANNQGEYSLFNEDYKWHFTHPLYPTQNKTMADLAQSSIYGKDLKKRMPKAMFRWLLNNKSFPSSGGDDNE